ncbi:MAG TPA: methyltransferase [Candidatus Paceibacterota bacterium]
MPIIPLEELKKDKEIKDKLLGHELQFATTWGLFCPEEIDEGTRLLLGTMKKSAAGNPEAKSATRILDVGCGYGPIGIVLAKEFPEASVEMIDKDFVAVEYSMKNAAANHVDNARVKTYLSNGFSHVPDGKQYDLIVSNLPAKASKEFYWILFGEAFEHLEIGGSIVVVAIRQLEPMTRKSFDAVFGNFQVLAQSNTYSVMKAVKTKDSTSSQAGK